MLYNLNQYLYNVAQLCGIQNSAGQYGFDSSTFPDATLAVDIINDAGRESIAPYDYTFKFNTVAMPFYHVISGVQSVNVSGANVTVSGTFISGTSATGIITPYPSQVLNYSWNANQSVQDINSNYSGISFTDSLGNPSLSALGNPTFANWTGIGFQYQLNPDVDKIIDISIQKSINGNSTQGVIQGFSTWHDMINAIPIGIVSTSGTPIAYLENPGMSPTNDKTIQFFPMPDAIAYSGEAFIVAYLKKWVDLVNGTDVQTTIPENFQNIVTFAAAQKIFDINTDGRALIMENRKNQLIDDLKVWDWNQPNKINMWIDYHYRNSTTGGAGRSAFDTSVNIFLP